MFDFLKTLTSKSSGNKDVSYSIGRHSCIQASANASIVVMNLDHSSWTVQLGGGQGESLQVPAPGGIEVFDNAELIRQVTKSFRSIASESSIHRMFKHAFENESLMLLFLPAGGEVRYEIYEALEEFLKKKFHKSTKDIDSIKLYGAPRRPKIFRSIRKFKGKSKPHTVFNLTSDAYRYFHYFSDDKQDVTIDSIIDDWPEGRMELTSKIEGAIRAMDPTYFQRIRESLRDGVLALMLPRQEIHRRAVLKSAQKVLEQVPGEEAIDLMSSRVLNIYRGRA